MVVNGGDRDPGLIRLKYEFPGVAEPERTDQAERRDECHQGCAQREHAYELRVLLGQQHRNEKTCQRDGDYDVQQVHRAPPASPITISSKTDPKTTQAA